MIHQNIEKLINEYQEILDLIHLYKELLPLSVVVVEVVKEQFEMVQQVVLVVVAEVTLH